MSYINMRNKNKRILDLPQLGEVFICCNATAKKNHRVTGVHCTKTIHTCIKLQLYFKSTLVNGQKTLSREGTTNFLDRFTRRQQDKCIKNH
jgi:hypothetical protein